MPDVDAMELDVLELSTSELRAFEIIDIREEGEDPSRVLKSLLGPSVREMPLSGIEKSLDTLDKAKSYLFICQRGRRSSRLVEDLRSRGFSRAYSLKDGVEAVRRKFIA